MAHFTFTYRNLASVVQGMRWAEEHEQSPAVAQTAAVVVHILQHEVNISLYLKNLHPILTKNISLGFFNNFSRTKLRMHQWTPNGYGKAA